MEDITYNGEKALLITSEDLKEIERFPRTRKNIELHSKLDSLRKEGYKWVFILTSWPLEALPKILRRKITGERFCYEWRV